MRKRSKVSLSLIVAETVRSGPVRRSEPPALHLVSPTGGELDVAPARFGEEPAEFIFGRIGHGLDAIQELSRCRDWAEVLSVQQRWAQRAQAEYVQAGARLAEAAIRMVTGAATPAAAPEPS